MGQYSVEQLAHFNCSVCAGWWTVGDGDVNGKYACPHCGTKQNFTPAPPIGTVAVEPQRGNFIAAVYSWAAMLCLGIVVCGLSNPWFVIPVGFGFFFTFMLFREVSLFTRRCI